MSSINQALRPSTGNHFRPKSAPLSHQLSCHGVPAGPSTNTPVLIAPHNTSRSEGLDQQQVQKKKAQWRGASEKQPVLTRPRSALPGSRKIPTISSSSSLFPPVTATGTAPTPTPDSPLTSQQPTTATEESDNGPDAGGGFGAPNYSLHVGSTQNTDTVAVGQQATLRVNQLDTTGGNTTASGIAYDETAQQVEADPLFQELISEKVRTSAQRSAVYKRMMGRESRNTFVAVKALKRPTSALSYRSSPSSVPSSFLHNRSQQQQPSSADSPSPLLNSTSYGVARSSSSFFQPAKSNVGGFKEPQSATTIERRLIEALAVLNPPEEKAFDRIQAHRLAFAEYIQMAPLPVQGLLDRIYTAYESVVLHEYKTNYDDLFHRLRVSETRGDEATRQVQEYQYRMEGLRLEVSNLEREVNTRNELLSQISATYKINISTVNWITGTDHGNNGNKKHHHSNNLRTMAEIRTVQKRVTTAYGEAQRAAARSEEEAQHRETPAQKEQQLLEMQQAEEVIDLALHQPQQHQQSDNEELKGRGGARGAAGSSVMRPASASRNASSLNNTTTGSSYRRTSSLSGGLSGRSPSPEETLPLLVEDEYLYRDSQRVEHIGVDLEVEAHNSKTNYVQPTPQDVHPE